MKRRCFFITILSWALGGCLLGMSFYSCSHENEQLETCVDSFAQSYFRWKFHHAINSCDTTSHRWLRYVASQVTQNDVDCLKGMTGDVSCSLVRTHMLNDSMAIVEIQVVNFLRMDSMGCVTLVEKESTYGIPTTLRDGLWRVSLRAVPEPSEKD